MRIKLGWFLISFAIMILLIVNLMTTVTLTKTINRGFFDLNTEIYKISTNYEQEVISRGFKIAE